MATSRKTIRVAELIESVNRRFETQNAVLKLDGLTPEQVFRTATLSLLEEFLHKTDNYAGYKYQLSEVDSAGSLVPETRIRSFHHVAARHGCDWK